VAITSSGIVIAASGPGGGGLILQQSASSSSVQQALPTGIASFDDVSIDAGNEALVFALSTISQQVCSFTLSDGDLNLVNCVGEGDDFEVSPFCGVSALDSTLIISGGVGGLTIYQYDIESGMISDSPNVLNRKLQGVVGHPDVVLVSAGLAALSTDFSFGFGTLMASIQESDVNNVKEFRVENTLGFAFFATSKPANFPLVNAIYETETGTYMYTANGPMQVQEPILDNAIDVLSGAPTGFLATTVAVNTAKKIVVFGGVDASGGNQILFYDLSVDPRNPSLVESVPVTGQRILSIASGGDVAAYTTVNLATIQYEQLPTSSPASSPVTLPIRVPTEMSSPIPTSAPKNSPINPPTSSPKPPTILAKRSKHKSAKKSKPKMTKAPKEPKLTKAPKESKTTKASKESKAP